MEHQFLGMIDQQAGVAVHYALGFASGTGGIQDIDRVVRRQWRE